MGQPSLEAVRLSPLLRGSGAVTKLDLNPRVISNADRIVLQVNPDTS